LRPLTGRPATNIQLGANSSRARFIFSILAGEEARSIKYQLTTAKLPLAKDLNDFDFTGTPVNGTLIRDLAGGAFVAGQRNVLFIDGKLFSFAQLE
jgi:hypothetical protein